MAHFPDWFRSLVATAVLFGIVGLVMLAVRILIS